MRHYDTQGLLKSEAFRSVFDRIRDDLMAAPKAHIGEWQSQKIDHPMRELLHVNFMMPLTSSPEELAEWTGAHLPWAEDHFRERVGGEPLNPSPSEAWWPFAKKKDGDTNAEHKSEGEAFSHTYPERMWPKFANVPGVVVNEAPWGQQQWGPEYINRGIRFDYGDLGDVVQQLRNAPNTRQAFLPIWFPEDTGAVHGKRVPCTLGYHFTIRRNKLHITYFMRSTDLLRHFQDDIYLAGRLAQWVAEEFNRGSIEKIEPALLIFHTVNMHIFDADVPMMEYRKSQGLAW